jgi:hypothetical protein
MGLPSFDIPCEWPEGRDVPEKITCKGLVIKVIGRTETGLGVSMNPDLSYTDHVAAVASFIEGGSKATKEIRIEMPLDPIDLDSMEEAGVPVWDSIFRKPEPVTDLTYWSNTPFVDQFIYLPNSIRKQGVDSEEYIANAQYTEVLANAYSTMCWNVGIQPVALLADGQTQVRCWMVQAHDGSQLSTEGSRSARLANSRLWDFDDSRYAKDFLKAIMSLKPHQYESDSILRTVLAKAEYILMGRTSHTYNQKFLKRFLEKFDTADTSSMDIVLHMLSSMIAEGKVLEDSAEEFRVRIIRARMDSQLDTLMDIFKSCKGGFHVE